MQKYISHFSLLLLLSGASQYSLAMEIKQRETPLSEEEFIAAVTGGQRTLTSAPILDQVAADALAKDINAAAARLAEVKAIEFVEEDQAILDEAARCVEANSGEVEIPTSGKEHVKSLTQALHHLKSISSDEKKEDSDPDSEGSQKLSEFRNQVTKVRRTLLKAAQHSHDEDTTKLFKVMRKLNRRTDKLFEKHLDCRNENSETLTSHKHHPAFVYLIETAGKLAKVETANDAFINCAISLYNACTTLPIQ